MLKAIAVKKQILGNEVSADIAYLYKELAVTYHGNDDLENASKCIKKQLAIWDQLGKNNNLDYSGCLTFLGELYRDNGMTAEAIEALERGIRMHEVCSEDGPEATVSQVSAVGQN